MSTIVFDLVLIVLFIVYLVRFREKSLLFALGVCWFAIEIISSIAYLVVYEIATVSTDVFGDDFFEFINCMNIGSVWIRIVEYVILFLIVLCFFVKRQKEKKSEIDKETANNSLSE